MSDPKHPQNNTPSGIPRDSEGKCLHCGGTGEEPGFEAYCYICGGDGRTPVSSDRFTCTAEHPWNKSISDRAYHPDAFSDGECSAGCCDYYYCPNCGLRFSVEVAQ